MTRGAAALRAWRERNRLTQQRAAEKFLTSRQTYGLWETGKIRPNLTHVLRIQPETFGEVPLDSWTKEAE
jgi:DNA-binding XRE family transcriptional regulator